jgi:hypothetical protein
MRDILCGFTTAEVNHLKGNAVSDAARLATEAHDTFIDTNTCAALDVFMDSLAMWRESAEYPFKKLGGL